jgi:hypothetical protein
MADAPPTDLIPRPSENTRAQHSRVRAPASVWPRFRGYRAGSILSSRQRTSALRFDWVGSQVVVRVMLIRARPLGGVTLVARGEPFRRGGSSLPATGVTGTFPRVAADVHHA